MRLLELILVMSCAVCSIRLAGAARGAWIHAVPVVLAVLVVAQVWVEGWRWQLFPAYTAVIITACTPLLLQSAGTQLWSSLASLALLAISIAACLVLPFVTPQTPDGPFRVGVITLAPNTVQRAKPGIPASPGSSAPAGVGTGAASGELSAVPLVHVWYPSEASPQRSLATWASRRIAAHLRAEATDATLPGAPIAAHGESRFPVIVYFDGWPENRIQNTNLIRALASRGFVVASVEYPTLTDRPMVDYASEAAFRHSVQADHDRARAHAKDTVAILDALESLDRQPASELAHRLDTQHAGTLGFSFGGAIAAESSRLDPRIRAVVNMDGRHWGDSLEKGVERPYLFICEELAMPTAADLASSNPMIRYEALLDQTDYSRLDANLRALGGVRVTIPGTAHMNFTDVPLRSPLRRLSQGGTIDPREAQHVIQTYVIEFFTRYLRSGTPPGLDSPLPQLPGVRVQSWPAPKAST